MLERPSGATVVIDSRHGANLLLRIVWFVLIGWWLSFFVVSLAVIANLTIVGIPLGIWLINRIPQAATLKFDRSHVAASTVDAVTTVTISDVPQRPFWQRTLWYILVGWWLTALALYVAWLLCVIVIGMPLAFPIFSGAGKLLTLKRG